MTAKRIIYPKPDPLGMDADLSDDNLYTGRPDFGAGQEQEMATPPFRAQKGRAAYSSPYADQTRAQDEMPSPMPRNGSVGGLFVDLPPESQTEGRSDEGGILAEVQDDALAAECARRVCPSCPVRQEADDTRLRALADLDNAKKRLERERGEQIRFAAEKVLSDIIPSLDNLDLALRHAGTNDACKDFVTGVRMTRKLMQEALAIHGLTRVGEEGEEFDPAMHEAVGMVASHDVPDNHVCALLSHGYKLHDRLLRPARVMVCKNG